MTIKQMEYIVELSRTRNFNRAADNLFISQPALTYQIKRAEEELGFLIFQRSGKGAMPTEAGIHFVQTISRLLEDYNATVDDCRRRGREHEIAVNIALPHRLFVPKFNEWRIAFESAYPDSPVLIRYYDSDEGLDPDVMQNIDLIIKPGEQKGRHMNGWREYSVMDGYMGTEELAITESKPTEDSQGIVWVPYSARPVEVQLLGRQDEKRRIVHSFIDVFCAK